MSELIRPSVINDATIVSTNVTETVALWSSATAYVIGDTRRRDTTHRIYKSLSSNTNKVPESSPSDWSDIGPANIWGPFDDSYRTQTSMPSDITYVVGVVGYADRLALLNLAGSAVEITVRKDAVEVFNRTYSLLDDSAIVNFWTYYYEPFRYRRDLTVNIPITNAPEIEFTVSGAGTRKIGLARWGLAKFIGDALYGSSVGNRKYSIPKFTDFGVYTPSKQRPNAKRGSFDMALETALGDDLKDFFDDLDITPVVFNMAGDYTRGKIWGFIQDADFTWQTYGRDQYRLTIEGLT